MHWYYILQRHTEASMQHTEYTFSVYSRRWGHRDTYRMNPTATGWDFGFITGSGHCDKFGEPCLYQNLDHDSIHYPEALPGYLGWLWDRINSAGMGQIEIQTALDQLAEWVSVCEQSSPTGIFSEYS